MVGPSVDPPPLDTYRLGASAGGLLVAPLLTRPLDLLAQCAPQEVQSLFDQVGIREFALRREFVDEAGKEGGQLAAGGLRTQPRLCGKLFQ